MHTAEKKKSTTSQQFMMLFEEMEKKPDIARGLLKYPQRGVRQFWIDLTTKLNHLGPPRKSTSVWKKVWYDWKANVKKKFFAYNQELTNTDEGPEREIQLTPLDRKMIELIALMPSVSDGASASSFTVPFEIKREKDLDIGIEDASTSTTESACSKTQNPDDDLLREQLDLQEDFNDFQSHFKSENTNNESMMSKHFEAINDSILRLGDLQKKTLEEYQRHHRVLEEIQKKKVALKAKKLKLLAYNRRQKKQNEYEKISSAWAVELRKMEPPQQLFAKKAINDILFEGMSALHGNSLHGRNNCTCTSIRHSIGESSKPITYDCESQEKGPPSKNLGKSPN